MPWICPFPRVHIYNLAVPTNVPTVCRPVDTHMTGYPCAHTCYVCAHTSTDIPHACAFTPEVCIRALAFSPKPGGD